MHNTNYFYIHRITPPFDAERIDISSFEILKPLFKAPGIALKLYTLIICHKPYNFRYQYNTQYCSKEPTIITRSELHHYKISKQEFHLSMKLLLKLGYIIQRNTNTFDFYEVPIYKMTETISKTRDYFTAEELAEQESILNDTWYPKK